MNLSTVILGMVISSLIGTGFHLFTGGNFWRIIGNLVLAWIGFWIGQGLAEAWGWTFLSVGVLHLGVAIPLTFFALGLGWLFSKNMVHNSDDEETIRRRN